MILIIKQLIQYFKNRREINSNYAEALEEGYCGEGMSWQERLDYWNMCWTR